MGQVQQSRNQAYAPVEPTVLDGRSTHALCNHVGVTSSGIARDEHADVARESLAKLRNADATATSSTWSQPPLPAPHRRLSPQGLCWLLSTTAREPR